MSERIIGTMKYKFCEQLQKSVFLGFDSLLHCCTCDLDRSPTFFHYYKGEKIDWRNVIDEKIRLQNEAKKGKIPFSACENCHFLKEKEWEDGAYISEITISHWTKCNCNCFYCYTARDKKLSNSREHYALMPLLKDMKEARGGSVLDFSKGDGIIRFLGGDVAMLDELEEFINFFLDLGAKNFYIPTSGIKYLPIVSKVLETGSGEVIISHDCGSPEMYKKIKRVDKFDEVMQTTKKYAASAKKGNAVFKSKYILLPFVNDTKEEIDKWLNNCVEAGVEYVADDCEENFISIYKNSIPPHVPEMMEYIHTKGEELGLKVNRFRYAFQLFYELEQGIAKVAKTKRKEKEQHAFVENLLNR